LGQEDSTGAWFQHYVALSDSIYQIRKDKEISDIENNHVVELHDRELAAHRARLHWTWGILFTLFVLITSLIVLLNDRKHKAKALKYEQQLKDIERRYVRESIQLSDEDEDENRDEHSKERNMKETENQTELSFFSLQKERLALFHNQYLASKWSGYLISHQSDIEAKAFMSLADSEQFLKYLNELFVNMIVDLHRENDRLNQDDMDYCCMTMLGLSINQIAYCCRKPIKYCYNRRTRLGERLTLEWYQFVFGKPPKQV
jgi:hypothetical protein